MHYILGVNLDGSALVGREFLKVLDTVPNVKYIKCAKSKYLKASDMH